MRESEEKFRTLTEFSPVGIFLNDAQGNAIYINSRCAELVGIPADQSLNQEWARNLHREDRARVLDKWTESIRNAVPFQDDYRWTHPDGRDTWTHGESKPVRDVDGNISMFIGTLVDITERKRAEEKLRESERRLAEDVKSITGLQQIGALFLRESNFQQVLDAIVETALDISGTSMGNLQLLDPASGDLCIKAHRGFHQSWVEFWDHAYTGKGVCTVALERGERVIVEDLATDPIFIGTPALKVQLDAGILAVQSTPLISRTGKILGMISTHFNKPHRPDERTLRLLDLLMRQTADMIDHAQAQAELRASEEQLQNVLLNSPDTIYTLDLGLGKATFLNREEFCGYSKRELESPGSIDAAVHQEDLAVVRENWSRIMRGNGAEPIEYRLRRKDGTWIWIGQRISVLARNPQGAPAQLLVTLSDITERKRAEESIRYQATLLAKVNDAVVGSDENFVMISWNSAAEKIYGWTEEEAIGKVGEQLFHSEFIGKSRAEAIAELRDTGQLVVELIQLRKDGVKVFIESHATALRDDGGKTIGYISINRDITERKRADAALAESEEKYRSIYENSSVAILLTAPDGRILSANDFACSLFQRSEQDICAVGRQGLIDSKDARLPAALEERKRTGRVHAELSFVKADGTRFPGEVSSLIFREKHGEERTSLIIRDLTEQKAAETKVLETLDELRALTAHLLEIREEERTAIAREIHDELGQALTGMKMDIAFIKKKVAERQKTVHERLTGMSELLNKTVTTVRKISSELRPGILDDLGLVAAIEWETRGFERRTGIVCSFDPPSEDFGFDPTSATAIYRILQESMTNIAKHAGASSVHIRISLSNGVFTLSVEDDGSGFQPDALARRKSFGIRGMQERASTIGGSVTIGSREMGGTRVLLTVPIGNRR